MCYIGEDFSRAVVDSGFTKSEIARATGMARTTVDRILHHPSRASAQQLQKVADACGLEVRVTLAPDPVAAMTHLRDILEHSKDAAAAARRIGKMSSAIDLSRSETAVYFSGAVGMITLASAPDFVGAKWMLSGSPIAGYSGTTVLWVDATDRQFETIRRALSEDLTPVPRGNRHKASVVLDRANKRLFEGAVNRGGLFYADNLQVAIDSVATKDASAPDILEEVSQW